MCVHIFCVPLLPDNVNTVQISVARNLNRSNLTIPYYIDHLWKIDVFVSLNVCTIQWDSRKNKIISKHHCTYQQGKANKLVMKIKFDSWNNGN